MFLLVHSDGQPLPSIQATRTEHLLQGWSYDPAEGEIVAAKALDGFPGAPEDMAEALGAWIGERLDELRAALPLLVEMK